MPDFSQDIRDHKFWALGTPDAPIGKALIYAISPASASYVVGEIELENPAEEVRYLSEKYGIPVSETLKMKLNVRLDMNFSTLYVSSDLNNAIRYHTEREDDVIALGQLDGSKSLRLYANDYIDMYIKHVLKNLEFYWMLNDNLAELAKRFEES
jgi:thiamine pyrophosphate-dependent acetolactate synthase large subunit-like protein